MQAEAARAPPPPRSQSTALLRNGVESVTAMLDDIAHPGTDFIIGNATAAPYGGFIDEVFFTTEALDEASVRRIWACGIAGDRCQCDSDNPTAYALCGEAEPSCGSLPACNALAPAAM
jgi:hypothetical protein